MSLWAASAFIIIREKIKIQYVFFSSRTINFSSISVFISIPSYTLNAFYMFPRESFIQKFNLLEQHLFHVRRVLKKSGK
jgi:hypothetical protein